MTRPIVVNNNFFLCLFLFLTCLSLSSIMVNMANAGQYELIVKNGSGSGIYEENSKVVICADPSDDLDSDSKILEPLDTDAPIRVFDTWSGDTNYLKKIGASKTTLVMPARDLIITAEYITTSRWVAPRVQAIIPQPHIGIILFLHGLGGSAVNLTAHEETSAFIKQAVAKGYGVIAIDSYDRSKWDDEPSGAGNVDMQRIVAMRNAFIANDEISEDDPFFLAGFSMGGVFASQLAEQSTTQEVNIPVAATAVFASKLSHEVLSTTTVPTIFIMAENDTMVNLSLAESNFSDLLDLGIPTQLFVVSATPLHPHQLWSIDGLNRFDSETIYDALNDGGFLDPDGFLYDSAFEDTNGDGIANWLVVVPTHLRSYIFYIESQLLKSVAEHGFYNDYSNHVFAFFEYPTTILDIQPEITEFNPAEGSPSNMVTISGGNFVGIESVCFNGIETEFSVINSTVIRADVPSSATTGPITITNSAGIAMSPDDFIVVGPRITDFLPESGVTGMPVFIYGDNFVDIDQVSIGGIPTDFTVQSGGIISATVPTDAITGAIVVSNYLGDSTSTVDFNVPVKLEFTELYPTSGATGTSITVFGAGFAQTRAIYLGRITCQFEVDSDTQLQFVIPEGAKSSRITILSMGDRVTSSAYFKVLD